MKTFLWAGQVDHKIVKRQKTKKTGEANGRKIYKKNDNKKKTTTLLCKLLMACNYLNFRQLEKINTAAVERNIYDIFIMQGDEASSRQKEKPKK